MHRCGIALIGSNPTLIKDCEAQFFAPPEPDDIVGMIPAIVAGRSMGKNRQAGPIDSQPAGNFSELLRRHSNLDGSSRVRAHRLLMKVTYRDLKPLLDPGSQRLRLAELGRVEIDVSVKITHFWFNHRRTSTG
jgi:hypothetical protein